MDPEHRGRGTFASALAALVACVLAACAQGDPVRTDSGRPRDGAPDAQCAAGLSVCDGLCTDTTTDVAHCGACDAPCAAGDACVSGHCETPCPAGQTRCGSTCVSLALDPAHCGACATSCTAGQACVAGACIAAMSCPTGQVDCSGACVDTATSVANCGACAHACGAAQTCSGGACHCAAGLTVCGLACANTSTDASNCGACGHVCPGAGSTCSAGVCTVACGTPGALCCIGSTCTASGTTCVAGRCEACGASGQPCCPTGAACASPSYCNGARCWAAPRLVEASTEAPGCIDFGIAHATSQWTAHGRPGARGEKHAVHISCTGATDFITSDGCFTLGTDGTWAGLLSNPVITDCTLSGYGHWQSYIIVDGQRSATATSTFYNSTCVTVSTCSSASAYCPAGPPVTGLASCP